MPLIGAESLGLVAIYVRTYSGIYRVLLLEVRYAREWLGLYTNNRIGVCVYGVRDAQKYSMDVLHTEGQYYPRGSSCMVGSDDPLRHCFIVPLLSLAFFSLLIFLCFLSLSCSLSSSPPSPHPAPGAFLSIFSVLGDSQTLLLFAQATLNHGGFF